MIETENKEIKKVEVLYENGEVKALDKGSLVFYEEQGDKVLTRFAFINMTGKEVKEFFRCLVSAGIDMGIFED